MADMTDGGGLEVCLGAADCCRTPGGGREVACSTVGPGLVTGWVGSLGMPWTPPGPRGLRPPSMCCCCCCRRAAAVGDWALATGCCWWSTSDGTRPGRTCCCPSVGGDLTIDGCCCCCNTVCEGLIECWRTACGGLEILICCCCCCCCNTSGGSLCSSGCCWMADWGSLTVCCCWILLCTILRWEPGLATLGLRRWFIFPLLTTNCCVRCCCCCCGCSGGMPPDVLLCCMKAAASGEPSTDRLTWLITDWAWPGWPAAIDLLIPLLLPGLCPPWVIPGDGGSWLADGRLWIFELLTMTPEPGWGCLWMRLGGPGVTRGSVCLIMDGLGLNLERSGWPRAAGLDRSPGSMWGLGSPRSGDAGKPNKGLLITHILKSKISVFYLNQETTLEIFELEGRWY